MRQTTRFMLESDPDLKVIGEAGDGAEALSQVERLRPDVITMDLRMPRVDGLEAIRRIMAVHPAPIVVVTGVDLEREAHLPKEVARLGAVSILKRPEPSAPNYRAFAAKLVEQVKLMSDVKVVRRPWSRRAAQPDEGRGAVARPAAQRIEIVAIGSSTGGPAALHTVLSRIPANFPAPILIVQHISFGFVDGLASWLGGACPLRVTVAQPRERVQPGSVYLAPDNCHMQIDRLGRIGLASDEPIDGHRPSATALFKSVARAYGPAALGVILTGMGADGAAGLKAMQQAGALTIAQDEASCVVFGMPKEAIALGAVAHVVPLDRIAARIQESIAVEVAA
jgi:two-component system chemotaxis response regulator CheB